MKKDSAGTKVPYVPPAVAWEVGTDSSPLARQLTAALRTIHELQRKVEELEVRLRQVEMRHGHAPSSS